MADEGSCPFRLVANDYLRRAPRGRQAAPSVMRRALPILLPVLFSALLLLGGWSWVRHYTRHGMVVDVPDLSGLTIAEAEAIVGPLGLHVEVVDSVHTDGAPKGAVVDQDPDARSGVKPDRTVYLIVNATRPKLIDMPALVDLSKRQAISVAEIVGLKVAELRYRPERDESKDDQLPNSQLSPGLVAGLCPRRRHLAAGVDAHARRRRRQCRALRCLLVAGCTGAHRLGVSVQGVPQPRPRFERRRLRRSGCASWGSMCRRSRPWPRWKPAARPSTNPAARASCSNATIFTAARAGRHAATHPRISNARAGGYGKFSAQYGKLEEAYRLAPEAALRAASWGRFQIMGDNFKAAGFASVEAFVLAMTRSEAEHLMAFTRFVKNNKRMLAALRKHDWAAFAAAYNGPGYRKNSYDTKLEAAHRRFSSEAEKAKAAKPAQPGSGKSLP